MVGGEEIRMGISLAGREVEEGTQKLSWGWVELH